MINGRYTLEGPLDHVRFGSTYRATDREQSRSVCLWLLPPELGRNPGALETFKRDFARIRLLAHPNIGRVLSLESDGERWFVVAEFLDGETLRNVLDHLKPGRLDLDEVDAIVRALGGALAYAHGRGIVHGDVRAENVIVTMAHELKLANFMSTTLVRCAPFTVRPSDDVRDLAALAYELYGGRAADAGRLERIKGLPRRRWQAIEATLTRGARAPRGAAEFLVRAGLAEPDAVPVERPRPQTAASRVTQPRSLWRVVLPAVGLAAVGFALFTAVGRDWVDQTGRDIQAALRDVDARSDDGRGAAQEPAAQPAAQNDTNDEPPPAPDRAPEAGDEHQSERVLNVAAMIRDRSNSPGAARVRPEAADAPDGGVTTVSLSAPAVTVRESQSVATIDIVRSGPADHPVEVIWWTSDGTASARDDYAAFGRRLETIPAGKTTLTLHIPIGGDSTREPDEYFYVNLDPKPKGAEIGTIARATVTIIDDDR